MYPNITSFLGPLFGVLLLLNGLRRGRRHHEHILPNVHTLLLGYTQAQHAWMFSYLLQQFRSDLVVSNDPGQFWHFENKLLFSFAPL